MGLFQELRDFYFGDKKRKYIFIIFELILLLAVLFGRIDDTSYLAVYLLLIQIPIFIFLSIMFKGIDKDGIWHNIFYQIFFLIFLYGINEFTWGLQNGGLFEMFKSSIDILHIIYVLGFVFLIIIFIKYQVWGFIKSISGIVLSFAIFLLFSYFFIDPYFKGGEWRILKTTFFGGGGINQMSFFSLVYVEPFIISFVLSIIILQLSFFLVRKYRDSK